jgi:hypothetical protein
VDLPDASQGPLQGIQLRPEQQSIIDALQTLGAQELVQAYLGALRILSLPSFPFAVYLAGHACREIWRALPRWADLPSTTRIDYVQALDAIAPRWTAMAPEPGAQGGPVPIPQKVFTQVDSLCRQHLLSRQTTVRQAARGMFQAFARDPENGHVQQEAAVREWLDLGKQCDGLAHLRGKDGGAPEFEAARKALGALERVLWRHFVQPPFYAAVEALDEVLREANG